MTAVPMLSMMYCIAIVVVAELYFDLLVFAGVGAKDSNKLEYLKTSVKGMTVLRNSLIGDAARRFISVTCIVLLTGYLLEAAEFEFINYITCVLGSLFVIELVLLLERSITSMGVINCLNMLASAIALIFVAVLFMAGGSFLLICLVLYVAVVVIGRVVIMRKVRKGYYDEAN